MVSDCFMCGGREFQSLGAEQLNDRAPIEVSRDVGIHSPAEVERREWECILGGGRRGNWGLGCGELYR